MIDPRTIIDRHAGPRGEVTLASRTGNHGERHFELFVNGSFLMSSYSGPSSTALAAVGLSAIQAVPPWHILIGGLGLGFTLRRTLAEPKAARVTVVELEPCVIHWNREALGSANAAAMADPRVTVANRDLLAWLRDTPDSFSAILLDIDNGPTWTVHDGNAELYSPSGLERVARSLVPGGAVAFWASAPSKRFEALLTDRFGGFRLESVIDSDEEGRPVEAFIYLSCKPEV